MAEVVKYKIDMHTHTISSGHAYSTISENARYAYSRGIEYLGMTDHAPNMPGSCGALHFLNLKVIPDYIEGVRVLKGIELNIMDVEGNTDKSIRKSILKRLDIAIASLHIPCIKPSNIEENTMALVNAIKKDYVNIIGHIGDPRYEFDIKKVVSASRDYSTLLEVNNSSLRPEGFRVNTHENCKKMLEACKKEGTMIVWGSDAHVDVDIAEYPEAEELCRETGFPEELIANTSYEKLRSLLKHGKKV